MGHGYCRCPLSALGVDWAACWLRGAAREEGALAGGAGGAQLNAQRAGRSARRLGGAQRAARRARASLTVCPWPDLAAPVRGRGAGGR